MASIATEVKIVEQLHKEGLTKESIGARRVSEARLMPGRNLRRTYVRQLRRLGSSCDWTREAFTMDERCPERYARFLSTIINKAKTIAAAASSTGVPTAEPRSTDAEVEYEARDSLFVAYPLSILRTAAAISFVATTRPETMLGELQWQSIPPMRNTSQLWAKSSGCRLRTGRFPS
jgi:valyl-tRNA synthetase